MEFVCRGCEDGVAEQLLRQGAHGVRPFPNYGKVARGSLSLRLLLQQVKVAAERGERRAQVVEIFVTAAVSSAFPLCSRRRSPRSA